MFTVLGYAQTKTNIVQEGYYHVVSGLDTISSHSSKDNAIESMLNERLKGNQDVKILVPEIRVDVENLPYPPSVSDTIYLPGETEIVRDTVYLPGEIVRDTIYLPGKDSIVEVVKPAEIDTVIANLCWDVLGGKKQWNHATDDPSVWPHVIYIPTKEYSMMRVKFYDTLTLPQKYFQTRWKFKRMKDYANARTTYGTTGEVPFQFYIKDSVVNVQQTSVVVRVFGSEDWTPQYIVNGVQREPLHSSTPGSPEILGMPMRRHTCTIDGLEPGTTYDIQVKGYCRRDETETDIATFTLTTLP